MKLKAARQATALLVAACANTKAVISDPVFAFFDGIFEALRDDLAELLLRRLIAKSKKGAFPAVGDALREAAGLVLEDQGLELIDAEEAWALVRPKIETEGRNRKPLFKNPSINAAIENIGWSRLCETRPGASARAFTRIFAKLEARRLEQAAESLCPTQPALMGKAAVLALESEPDAAPRRSARVAHRVIGLGGIDRSLPAGDRE